MPNPITWFEIPVTDIHRAITFYNEVFGYDLKPQQFGGTTMAWFPYDKDQSGITGSLIHQPDYYAPSDKAGVLIYFGCDNIDETIRKIAPAGGKIIKEKTMISEEHGYMAVMLDIDFFDKF